MHNEHVQNLYQFDFSPFSTEQYHPLAAIAGTDNTNLIKTIIDKAIRRRRIFIFGKDAEKWQDVLSERCSFIEYDPIRTSIPEVPDVLIRQEYTTTLDAEEDGHIDRSITVIFDENFIPFKGIMNYFYNARHLQLSIIISTTTILIFPPGMVRNFDYIFVTTKDAKINSKYFAKYIPSLEDLLLGKNRKDVTVIVRNEYVESCSHEDLKK